MDLAGKSVFVTGGARGVGQAMVEALLGQGAKVFFVDILEEEGKATAAELHVKYGDNITFRLCDVSDLKQLTEAFEAAVSLFGCVDVYVSNAAICCETKWEKMIAINQVGPIHGSLLAYEHMRKDKGGRGGVIIIVASMSGFLYGEFFNPVYTATKHALVAFTTSMANNPEMPSRGVRWGCLCTNAVETPLSHLKPGDLHEYDKWDEFLHKYPRDKLKPSEVAEAFLVQLQDEANNGAVLKVAKKQGQPYHQMIVMDRSKVPVDTMIYKDKVFFGSQK